MLIRRCLLFKRSLSRLTLPPIAAFDTCHKGGHRLVGRARLQLVIRTFLGFTLATYESVGGGFDFWGKGIILALLLGGHPRRPFLRQHLLVCHKRKLVWFDFPVGDEVRTMVIGKVMQDRAPLVRVYLRKGGIVPFFNHLFFRGVADGVIVHTFFEIVAKLRVAETGGIRCARLYSDVGNTRH